MTIDIAIVLIAFGMAGSFIAGFVIATFVFDLGNMDAD
jgi:hypothetical protein